jgi:predicted acylesterase/phospholipase RssA
MRHARKQETIAKSEHVFAFDVISGTSAGGINGVFLAKALANEKNEGAIEKLLNDEQSWDGVKVKRPSNTESLLNGRRMYSKLLAAFDDMDQLQPERPPAGFEAGGQVYAGRRDRFVRHDN